MPCTGSCTWTWDGAVWQGPANATCAGDAACQCAMTPTGDPNGQDVGAILILPCEIPVPVPVPAPPP